MRLHFGPFCVDVGARQVLNGDASIHLTRKEIDLLLLLLEQRPNVVTKEQIYGRLWPNIFVSEASLQALVSDLREALDAGGPRDEFIRTVHGIGYAFCGAVRESGALPDPVPAVVRGWLIGTSGRIPLHAGENIVGRADSPELGTVTISRRHARIHVDSEGVDIEDLGSKNGTWVNFCQVAARQPLSEGDTVHLGSSVFTFQRARMSSSTVKCDNPEPTSS